MNCQIVLCKGVNDGVHLEKSLRDLAALAPYVRSTSVVPVGISCHREGLYPLQPFEKADAEQVIDLIERIGSEQRIKNGVRGCYASDEFYILADRELPSEAEYDGYPQIENGVGLMRSLRQELEDVLAEEQGDADEREVGVITGVLAAGYMNDLMKLISSKFSGLRWKVFPIVNHFFGEMITVSGLVTGTDILNQLKGETLPSRLLIPSSMLRAEQDMFLDSILLSEVSDKLNRPIGVAMNDGMDLLNQVLGR